MLLQAYSLNLRDPATALQSVSLGLVPVTVLGPYGQRTVCGLLDSESDSTPISADLTIELGLRSAPATISVTTVNVVSNLDNHLVSFDI